MILFSRPASKLLLAGAAAALLSATGGAFAQNASSKAPADTTKKAGAAGKFGLPKTPEEFFPMMAARFNSLDVDTALALFNESSIMVDGNGQVHRGVEAIRSELQRYFGMGLQMKLTPRHIYSSGDIALSINDWSYDGTAKDGTHVKMSGSTTDVLRRGKDGVWRYVIDNPFGTHDGN